MSSLGRRVGRIFIPSAAFWRSFQFFEFLRNVGVRHSVCGMGKGGWVL